MHRSASRVPPGGEIWEGRNRRRVTKAHLREISLVAEGAYPTRALDVRHKPDDPLLARAAEGESWPL